MRFSTSPLDQSVEEAFMAKAGRIAENAVREQRSLKPPAPHPLAKRALTCDDLLHYGVEIKRQIEHGNDLVLKGFGFSITGIAYFFETRLGLDSGQATILAHALSNLWPTRNTR